MRRTCLAVAGLGDGGDHMKMNVYDLKEQTARTQGPLAIAARNWILPIT